MVADAELTAVLAGALGASVQIRDRQPWPYASSFPLEWLDVETAPGERRGLLWKDITPSALLPGGRLARGANVPDPRRELRAYDLLEAAQLGTPRRVAGLVQPWRAWLFLEAVDGCRLDEVGELDAWRAVARWAAHAHTALAPWTERLDFPPRWQAPELAQLLAGAHGDRARRIAALAAPLAAAAACAAALPQTMIHGELYPANVLVAGERICVVDWETVAHGPALLDLAALTAGRWDVPAEPLAQAYRSALADPPPWATLLAQLDACRLLVAAGWLAAPGDWTPPPAQARDWLADAELIAARMLL